MTYEEAIEWLAGNRSTWNSHAGLSPDGNRAVDFVTCAQEDAAKTQQAYWLVRAHREGLDQEAPR